MTDDREAIDAIRTFANYAIVLMHAWAAQAYVARGTWERSFWDFVCNAMAAAVMPGLFLLSGYLLAHGFSLSTYGEKLGRRMKRLAIPYLVWNATFVVFYLCASKAVPRLGQRVASFNLTTWAGACSKIASFMVDPLDMPTWFMRTLFLYVLLSPVLWILLKRFKGVLAYLLLAFWLAVSLKLGWGCRLKFTYPFYSILAFTIGMHLSRTGISMFSVFRSKWWLLGVAVGMAGCFWHDIRWHWDYSIVRDISFLLMLPFIFTCATGLHRLSDRLPHWDFVRNSSFFLYTGHFLFCSMVLHSLAPLLSFWQGPGKLTFLIAVFCTLGVAVNLSAYWFGKRFLGKIFGVFDGTL